jgi:hypothetical protein
LGAPTADEPSEGVAGGSAAEPDGILAYSDVTRASLYSVLVDPVGSGWSDVQTEGADEAEAEDVKLHPDGRMKLTMLYTDTPTADEPSEGVAGGSADKSDGTLASTDYDEATRDGSISSVVDPVRSGRSDSAVEGADGVYV